MTKSPAKKRSTFYFSKPSLLPQFQYVAYVILVFVIIQVASGNYPQAGFFFTLALVILLLKSWSKLDVDKLKLVDFFAIIPYRTKKLDAIQKIIFTEGAVSQTMGLRANTSTIHYTEYKILLETEREIIKLQEGRNQQKLLKKSQLIAAASMAELIDQTT